jgi:hypothetical protein
MITATADQIKQIIVADPVLLRALHDFLDAVTGDVVAEIDTILDELPGSIAAHSPFATEASLVDVVRREMSKTLHALALHRLPASGRA